MNGVIEAILDGLLDQLKNLGFVVGMTTNPPNAGGSVTPGALLTLTMGGYNCACCIRVEYEDDAIRVAFGRWFEIAAPHSLDAVLASILELWECAKAKYIKYIGPGGSTPIFPCSLTGGLDASVSRD